MRTVIAPTGEAVSIRQLAYAATYNGDGTLATETFGPDVGGRYYTVTYSWSSGVLVGVTAPFGDIDLRAGFISGAMQVRETGQVGGERNTSSTTNNYDAVKQECQPTRVVGNTETLITNSPCFVLGYVANNGAVASSGYVDFHDANATGSGAGTIKMQARATGGDCPDLKALRFETGLTIQGSAAATDVTVFWRPI